MCHQAYTKEGCSPYSSPLFVLSISPRARIVYPLECVYPRVVSLLHDFTPHHPGSIVSTGHCPLHPRLVQYPLQFHARIYLDSTCRSLKKRMDGTQQFGATTTKEPDRTTFFSPPCMSVFCLGRVGRRGLAVACTTYKREIADSISCSAELGCDVVRLGKALLPTRALSPPRSGYLVGQ